jgi:PIN domain nuclease of toxin-antitoxin system
VNSILDACALIAYLQGELGGHVIEALLKDDTSACFAHAINLCEVYYHVLRQSDEATSIAAIDSLLAAGIEERTDFDRPFWTAVGKLKTRGRIALADCFCIALAQRLGGQLVTSDHGEYDPLVPLGLCPIFFIR